MSAKDIISQTELFLFDMDGTLYLGENLFPCVTELLAAIRNRGKRYYFVTNNSSRSVKDYVRKLNRLGITATEEDFLTSSQATARFLLSQYPSTHFYVCGTASLKAELRASGILLTENREEAEGIVIGNDTELTFAKLYDVCNLLTEHDMPYIATNPDYVCPTEFGSVPDCGSFCDMIFRCTRKRPLVIGKPEPKMIELAMEKAHTTPSETTVVGDRIYTDIKSGLNAHAHTILVMSGETTPEILAASEEKPEIVMRDVSEILANLND